MIADIHANLPALEAVLSDVAALGVSDVVVNGDLVNRGPSNVAVVERIVNLACVRALTLGNHDDLMRKWVERTPDIPALWFEDDFWRGMAWPAAQLRAAGKIDALKALPLTYRHTQPGLPQLLFSHGSPRHYREGYAPYLDDQTFSEIVGADPAEVFIGSHTHRPYERRVGQQLMLNTGAVGAPFNGDPRAQYLLLHPREGVWKSEFRAVPYDREAALAAFETSGYLEEGGLSARIFYDELRVARPLYMLFWEWTESRGRPKDWESWDAFKEAHAERFRDPA